MSISSLKITIHFHLLQWLGFFTKATRGDRHCQAVLARYSRLIAEKRAKADLKRILKGELVRFTNNLWCLLCSCSRQENQLRMRTQPIYTGGFLRPTIYHGPFPRMKPQPEHISMLIKNRIRARERRLRFKAQLQEDLHDLRVESEFEEGLRRSTKHNFPTFFSSGGTLAEWSQSLSIVLSHLVEDKSYSQTSQTLSP